MDADTVTMLVGILIIPCTRRAVVEVGTDNVRLVGDSTTIASTNLGATSITNRNFTGLKGALIERRKRGSV